MTPPSEGARKTSTQRPEDPPRADMVPECPPHHWVIVSGWQTCKKCNLEQKVPVVADTRAAPWQRRNTGKESAKPSEESKASTEPTPEKAAS